MPNLPKDCRKFADDASTAHASMADLAMFAELQNIQGSDEAAENIRVRSAGANRLCAAWLVLAEAFEATSTLAEASKIIDKIDDPDTRENTRRLFVVVTLGERDCPDCGKRMSQLPIAGGAIKWLHDETLSEDCAPGDREHLAEPAQGDLS